MALRSGDVATFNKFVAEDPKSLNLRGQRLDALYVCGALQCSDCRPVARQGRQSESANDSNATALMWAATDLEKDEGSGGAWRSGERTLERRQIGAGHRGN
jgi:hypothetical protein